MENEPTYLPTSTRRTHTCPGPGHILTGTAHTQWAGAGAGRHPNVAPTHKYIAHSQLTALPTVFPAHTITCLVRSSTGKT